MNRSMLVLALTLTHFIMLISCAGVALRHVATNLSDSDVRSMLQQKYFYDDQWQKEGQGIKHAYKLRTIGDDKVLVDKKNKLMWQQTGSMTQLSFEDIDNYINMLNNEKFAGFSDWRLPTLEEAMSVLEPDTLAGIGHIYPFFDNHVTETWTSDMCLDGPRAWAVNFKQGNSRYGIIFFSKNHVKAVRTN